MGKFYKCYWILICLLLVKLVDAQPCYKQGQTPPLAIPVCGTAVFYQDSVSICDGQTVPVPPCNNGTDYTDKNPFWYKFHCFVTGTLGFLIIPNVATDDYDWQLFDVTGHNPNDVYTDASLFVACNWSGVEGNTGAVPNSTAVNSCSSPTSGPQATPNQSKMPTIYQGHDYLLMISHFTQSQSGYQLTFEGGTAVISDTTSPRVKQARAYCDGSSMFLVLSKEMRCSSLAPDGSDFVLSPPLANIISAVGNCNGGYDMDSIQLTLSGPLPPGNYNLVVQVGTDGNTLLDICYNSIPAGTQVPVSVYPLSETPMDSISPVDSCNPTTLQLVFRRPIMCSSLAANGSDFTITGPSAISVIGEAGVCDSKNLTSTITLTISPAIFTGGIYTLHLQKGSDGNSIIDECNFETAPSSINFYVKQAVSAKFNDNIKYSCGQNDTVYYSHNGNNGTLTWNWTFYNGTQSTLQNPHPVVYYYNGVEYTFLKVTNKECTDTATMPVTITLPDYKARFDATQFVCPADVAVFTNTSIGNIGSYYWDFANGNTSTLQNPPDQHYISPGGLVENTVQLIIEDTTHGLHCYDTATRIVTSVPGCLIAVPSAFTPNGDGLNDYLYPINGYKAQNLEFKVFNRWGQMVFETTDWTIKWDGTVNGQKQNPGTYVWELQYTDGNTGKKVAQKGTVVLIR